MWRLDFDPDPDLDPPAHGMPLRTSNQPRLEGAALACPAQRWLLPTRDAVGVHCLPGPCTTNLKILAKKERIFQHHGITVGVGIGIGIAIAVAIAIENCA